MSAMIIDLSEKPQTIDLDCRTRAKIIIPTKLSTSKRPIDPSVSGSWNFNQPNTHYRAVQGLGVQAQVPLPHVSTKSPQPNPKMHAKSKTIENSKVTKQRTPSQSLAQTGPSGRKTLPLPSRLRISSTSSSVTPPPEPEPVRLTSSINISIPMPSRHSQYAEEYDQCLCARRRARGKPPCDRCHLMLLADRFCELIDVQCERWGISRGPV